MKEQFISVSGTGFPAQAHREHAQHTFYARQTLYAYAPCPKLLGLEYIDVMVKEEYQGSWPAALRAFVQDPLNKWCPPWIRTNYQILNDADSDDDDEEGRQAGAKKTEQASGERSTEETFPHQHSKKIKKVKYVFEDDGEPPEDEAEKAATTLDPWDKPRYMAIAQRMRTEREPNSHVY